MASREGTSLPFSEFRQAVRQFRPSQLLPILARLANATGDPPYDFSSGIAAQAPPWFTALAARESLLCGNEHRSLLAGRDLEKAITRIRSVFALQSSSLGDDNLIQSELIRIAYEQFPYQSSVHEDIGRTHAMLVEPLTDPDLSAKLKVISDDTWTNLLGAPLGQAVGATLLHWVSANQLGGHLNLDVLTRGPKSQTFLDAWPIAAVDATTKRLVATVDQFRADYASVHEPEPDYPRYAYNPLIKTPFVRLKRLRLPIAPQPRFILNTVTPASLYHVGRARFGNDFSTDMGHLFEHYVGRQLNLIDGAQVIGEREYGPAASLGKTVDWIVVFPDCVLLIEVKSRRLAIVDTAKRGRQLDEHVADLMKSAADQLTRSHQLILDRAEVLADVPADRPLYGLIVTAEPSYFANMDWVRGHLADTPIPTSVASIRDIEELVRLPARVLGRTLQSVLTDPGLRIWDLVLALTELHPDPKDWGPNNELVHQGWNSYPWPEMLEEDKDQDAESREGLRQA